VLEHIVGEDGETIAGSHDSVVEDVKPDNASYNIVVRPRITETAHQFCFLASDFGHPIEGTRRCKLHTVPESVVLCSLSD
jgi:hypothetical protein